MRLDDADDLPRYDVQLSEPAEMEADAAYLGRMRFGERVAKKWYSGFLRALETLSRIPRGFPIAPDSDHLGGGVRQMLYGKGSAAYRILYRIIEPRDDEPGIVYVVRVRPASQSYLDEESDR